MSDAMKAAVELARDAEQLYSEAEVEAALARMAVGIGAALGETDPLLLSVMVGGLVTTGKLLTLLDFPLQLDYLHATRYGAETSGGELKWHAESRQSLAGRTVLVVDDIFDEGVTLAAILDYCRKAGAKEVYSAVLLDKQRQRSVTMRPDFVALSVPDRFVFGYGLDCKGYHRNAPGVYALREE